MIGLFIRDNGKVIGAMVGVLALIAFCALAWFNLMEKTPVARKTANPDSDEHFMLAASTLLRQHGYGVRIVDTLDDIDRKSPPPGTLMILSTGGLMPLAEAKDFLAWVKRGNTLVARPRVMNDAETAAYQKAVIANARADADGDDGDDDAAEDNEDGEDAEGTAADSDAADDGAPETVVLTPQTVPLADIAPEETDPLGAYLGVRLYPEIHGCFGGKCSTDQEADAKRAEAKAKQRKAKTKAATKPERARPPLFLGMPDGGHWLEVRNAVFRLGDSGKQAMPYWGDQLGQAVRVYDTGKGRIIMQASNFYGNKWLREHDHAELLLGLVALNASAKHVTIVRNLVLPKWYVLFWEHYRLALISVACFLLLLLWAAVRRFGPLLPMPEGERRSLMEHIDASGAWLWNAEGGRLQLLEAARRDTLALIERRAPKLSRLPPGPMASALAALVDLPESHVIEALHSDTAPHLQLFTRQIRTLQTLRNHYER
jgi:hypothetical protein